MKNVIIAATIIAAPFASAETLEEMCQRAPVVAVEMAHARADGVSRLEATLKAQGPLELALVDEVYGIKRIKNEHLIKRHVVSVCDDMLAE